MKSRPTASRGFTLIELLVVVAIIALLIAILLPSLSKSRAKAKLVACASNLHAIAIGVNTYAAEYSNYLPVQPGQGTNTYVVTGPYTAYGANAANVKQYCGFALMYQLGNVTNSKVFYCPAQTSITFSLPPASNIQGDAWLTIAKNASDGGGRMGYQYQVHPSNDAAILLDSGNAITKTDVAYPRIVDYPKNAIMAMDIYWATNLTELPSPHSMPHDNSSGRWNAAYVDGHVTTINSATASSKVTAMSSKWVKFYTGVTYLEKDSKE